MPRTLTHDGTDQPFFNPDDGRNSDINKLEFKEGVKVVGCNAFLYAGEVEEVEVPEGVTVS